MADGVVEIGNRGAAADPGEMHLYQTHMVEPDVALNAALRDLDGAVAAYNGAASEVGGRVDTEALAALSTAVDHLTYLDGWVDRVGQGFARADAFGPGGGPMGDEALDFFVGPADLVEAQDSGYIFDVTDHLDDSAGGIHCRVVERDGTRVVVVTLDDAQHVVTAQEWLLVAERLGIDPRTGLVDTMVHGYNTSADDAQAAGEAQARLYDEAGVEGATVVVVDWDGGSDVTQFHHAQGNVDQTGGSLGSYFDYVGVANPNANMNITAHSMGNDVVLQGLADAHQMPTTTDIDYVAVQPAVDADFHDDPEYDFALGRVDHLDMTVNPDDSALGHYERFYGDGDAALGDDTIETATENLTAGGAPADTQLHLHDEDHASLNPDKATVTGDLLRERTEEEAVAQGG